MSDRPRIGVSACLLGERVRYDAGHKRDAWLVDVLGAGVEWVPVCPEVEAGFGTPREAMQLERRPDGDVALLTVETRRDLTETMRRYAEQRAGELARADLDGYVFKADSPSCGIDEGFARGMFADAVMRRMPGLPVEDERRLADPAVRQSFVDRVVAHCRSRMNAENAGHAAQPFSADSANSAFNPVSMIRVRGGARASHVDRVAAEEPLEIRLHGRAFAVIMRTPGADRELAAGFLLAERVITGADDLGTIEHCRDAATIEQPQSSQSTQRVDFSAVSARSAVAFQNVVNVTLTDPDRVERALADRRQVTTNSSCGLCGRRTIESIAADAPPIRASLTISSAVLVTLPERLRAAQAVFDETGGLHAAALFTPAGELVDAAEDVGRHNAVDKVVGRMLMREALPLSGHLLCVSGRASFEIVQKALFAGIPIVAAVSAPSSLAIELADECGVTLVGFVRGDSFNIYTHANRIA